MPQASDDLRDLMRLMFHEEWLERGPVSFLEQRGYTLTHTFEWELPSPGHVITEKEELCIRFLRDEWDYGGTYGGHDVTISS